MITKSLCKTRTKKLKRDKVALSGDVLKYSKESMYYAKALFRDLEA